jgi:hypothetical protein
MDKREDGVTTSEMGEPLAQVDDDRMLDEASGANGKDRQARGDERPDAEEDEPNLIEDEIESIRNDVGTLLTEIDRRRHAVTNVRLQLRLHPRILLAVSVTGLLLLAGIGHWMYDRLRPDPPVTRARKIARALASIAKDPDAFLDAVEGRPHPRPSLISAVTRLAGTAGQSAVKHAIERG